MRKPVAVRKEVSVRTEWQFIHIGAGDLMPDVKTGVAFFRKQVLPVLRDYCPGAAIAADRTGIVNSVRVGICRGERQPAA